MVLGDISLSQVTSILLFSQSHLWFSSPRSHKELFVVKYIKNESMMIISLYDTCHSQF